MNELNLFQSDRTARQKTCIKLWIKANLHATVEAATGFGKTHVAMLALRLLLKKYDNLNCLIVVPTELLKRQWEQQLDELGLLFNCEVLIINSAIKCKRACDLLIIDEIHRAAADTFCKIFITVAYKWVLGLTATLERLDGKDEYIKKYCPICDTVSIEECLFNKWVSEYDEYMVLLDVPDIDIYKSYNKQFVKAFEFFQFDFKAAQDCLGKNGYKYKIDLAKRMAGSNDYKEYLKNITINAVQFAKSLSKRKAFINNHPRKIEVTQKIIKAYPNKKIITFSNNIKTAETIEHGKNVYSSRESSKKSRVKLEDYNKQEYGTIHTCKKADEGMSITGIEVAIILGLDSSKTRATQRLGRVIRYAPNKKAMIFNLVIKGTVEQEWFLKSHKDAKFKVIDEKGLDNLLKGNDVEEYQRSLQRFTFRY